jgi:tryptophanyl-tRNA synthetase
MRTLSGVQSSGKLHIGNYYGAIRQFVAMQDQGEALFFIANYHALNSVRDAATAKQLAFETAVSYLALGLNPAKAVLFRQSDIPELVELYWILGTVVPMSNLERAHSYKDKLAKGQASPDFGLFAYPVLMAADILLYGTDVVPVGKDQVQHLEFARDWATKFNVQYVKGYDPQDPSGAKSNKPGILKLPEARLSQATAVVPGINGEKMSKTYKNTIDLFGPEKEVEKAIKGIKTDSTAPESPKPLDTPLHQLLKVMAPESEWAEVDRTWRAGGTGYGDYKKMLLGYYHATFDGPRKRYDELSADPAAVEAVLKAGAQKARDYAAPIIAAVRAAVGL